MDDLFGILIALVTTFGGLSLGVLFGRWNEKKHFRKLNEREQATRHILKTQLKTFPFHVDDPARPPKAFYGEVVIANDTLKKFFASFRKFFGGQILSYQNMLSRARREALLRLVEQVEAAGYNAVCNIRYESADVTGNLHNKKAPVVASAFVVATAYMAKVQEGAAPEATTNPYQSIENPISEDLR